MDILPSLQQSTHQLNTVVQGHIVQRDLLETKTIEFWERLQKRREYIATCDKKLAELEAFKAEIQKKIVAYQCSRAQHNEYLAKEVSIAEKLKQTLAKTRVDVKKTTLQAEDKIVEYHWTLLYIASLGRRL